VEGLRRARSPAPRVEAGLRDALGRAKSTRRAALDADVGYRNGHGKPRRLTLRSGTITVRRTRDGLQLTGRIWNQRRSGAAASPTMRPGPRPDTTPGSHTADWPHADLRASRGRESAPRDSANQRRAPSDSSVRPVALRGPSVLRTQAPAAPVVEPLSRVVAAKLTVARIRGDRGSRGIWPGLASLHTACIVAGRIAGGQRAAEPAVALRQVTRRC
jgi:hypothetical protein